MMSSSCTSQPSSTSTSALCIGSCNGVACLGTLAQEVKTSALEIGGAYLGEWRDETGVKTGTWHDDSHALAQWGADRLLTQPLQLNEHDEDDAIANAATQEARIRVAMDSGSMLHLAEFLHQCMQAKSDRDWKLAVINTDNVPDNGDKIEGFVKGGRIRGRLGR